MLVPDYATKFVRLEGHYLGLCEDEDERARKVYGWAGCKHPDASHGGTHDQSEGGSSTSKHTRKRIQEEFQQKEGKRGRSCAERC